MARWTLDGPAGQTLTREDVARALGVTVGTLKKLIGQGDFPRGIPTGGKRLYWTGLDVAAYLYLRSRCSAGSVAADPDDEE